MKRIFFVFSCFFLLLNGLQAQSKSVEELQKELAEAATKKDQMAINYELGELLLRTRYNDALQYVRAAHNLAVELNDGGMKAQTAYLYAQVYKKQRKTTNEDVWLKNSIDYAKQIGDSDMIINATDKRVAIWRNKGNYRKALEIVQEAFEYFGGKGTSISALERKYERQRAALEKERQSLIQQQQSLQTEVQSLSAEKDKLTSDNRSLSRTANRLAREKDAAVEEKEAVVEEITETKKTIDTISRQKDELAAFADQKRAEVEKLSKDTLIARLLLNNTKMALKDQELELQRRQYIIYAGSGGLALLLLLAISLYSRFSAKRRSARALAEANEEIKHEKERSEGLLLNILPASIADELKANGHAKARHFDEVTVFFSDFKNFTRIAEELGPEELVAELDQCFKKFDEIISKYPDIEKIKTIGDAYMCASGFSDRKSLPFNLVKASLEMQAYLSNYKKLRISQGRPYFEARIGLHTGPVVAGVVGTKKFAYDIWGDTVNIASRMESNGDIGRVNISNATYQLIKYKFDCSYRGRIDAKNKGAIDMYFVEREVSGVTV